MLVDTRNGLDSNWPLIMDPFLQRKALCKLDYTLNESDILSSAIIESRGQPRVPNSQTPSILTMLLLLVNYVIGSGMF